MQEQTITALCAALTAQQLPFAQGEPLAPHTTFKIGGPADRFVEVKTVSELQAVLNAVSDENVPYFILGNGSNLLVPDEGLRGAVLTLQGDFKKVQSLANGHVLCGAGASLYTAHGGRGSRALNLRGAFRGSSAAQCT